MNDPDFVEFLDQTPLASSVLEIRPAELLYSQVEAVWLRSVGYEEQKSELQGLIMTASGKPDAEKAWELASYLLDYAARRSQRAATRERAPAGRTPAAPAALDDEVKALMQKQAQAVNAYLAEKRERNQSS